MFSVWNGSDEYDFQSENEAPLTYWGMSLEEATLLWADPARQHAGGVWVNAVRLLQAKSHQSEGLAELFHDPGILVSFSPHPGSFDELGRCWYRKSPPSGGFHTVLILCTRALQHGHWITFSALWQLYQN